ncbi:lysozyme inhibitor LprI family protein [Massilia aquatica]|uniref:DUF1311 domain-containing protein n=1 Tax=Massilia aquatica TaxID=2609000 RepID=A0ABX0M082_9BURK|nr:lysozyme inhibitor LprI family protein [Massilia aquatica]NHZ40544.1 DUF1311 domain-containing protein [Massilia aquatica]
MTFPVRALCVGLLAAIATINPAAAAAADDCKDPMSQYDMNRCSAKDAGREDALLNKNYKELTGKVDAQEKAQIKAVQLAWIKFRDLQCNYEADRYEGGSMQPLVHSSCLYALTKQRNKELAEMIREVSH